MEDSANIFTENELEELIALYNGGNTHDFAFEIFLKARENSERKDVTEDFFHSDIAPMLEETLDNPVFSMLPTETLAGILYMTIQTAISQNNETEA